MPLDHGGLGWLQELSADSRTILRGLLENYLKTDQLQDYISYPKQQEFHIAGRVYRNRLLRAGNQLGKTYSAGAEAAMHLTGEYPKWWRGKRFEHPITLWAAGETAESTRDNPQRVLLGLPKQVGTGMIPKRCLTGMYGRAPGIADAYEYRMVRHVSGGLSMLKFRNYSQRREAWQGPPVHVVWFDEEPPEQIYSEGLARTIAVKGITMMTFTPLLGYTPVVKLYLNDPDPEYSGRHSTLMTIYDALHLTEEEREKEIARWPKHERRARIMGEPALGEGMIYPYDQEMVEIEPFQIPDWWPVLGAIDPGGSGSGPHVHPTAAVKIAYDPDGDVIYVVREYRRKGLKPPEVWLALRHWGDHLRWAWPRDALITEKGTGDQMIQMYRDEGMRALASPAAWPERKSRPGSGIQGMRMAMYSVERGLTTIQQRIEVGTFKVFSTCNMFFEEFRQYHREEGKVVKQDDDLMDAARYAVMMLRSAEPDAPRRYRPRVAIDWQIGV